jgi:hypothetical protein
MVRLVASVAMALCILLTIRESAGAQDRTPPKPVDPAQVAPKKPTLSPLHAFLGIDPVTGEFRSPNASPPRNAPQTAETRPAGPAANSGAPATPPIDDPSADLQLGGTSVEEVRAAIVKALDSGDDNALASALLKMPAAGGFDQLTAFASQFAWVGYLLLLYPLGIVLSELYSTWMRRRQNRTTENDRRFYSRQLRRSLLLTACTAASIAIIWFAGEHNFWWNEPARLIAAVVALCFLGLIAASLRLINRRAASRYSLTVIEVLRRQQLALQIEVQELRKRLHAATVATALEPTV